MTVVSSDADGLLSSGGVFIHGPMFIQLMGCLVPLACEAVLMICPSWHVWVGTYVEV